MILNGSESPVIMELPKEVVLLTGSRGFLGQHVLKELLQDNNISNIRALDKSTTREGNYNNNNDNNNQSIYKDARNKVKYYQCDLVDLESCRDAFQGVDVVLHCAGYVDYSYRAPVDELEKNNIKATENVVKLCLEENVGRLIHCSSTEVTLQSSLLRGIVALSIYKPESQLQVPEDGSKLIFGRYAFSKLRAEKIVLEANGSTHKNGKGELLTVALRPTLLYGQGDPHIIPKILRLAKKRGNYLTRLSNIGGKQQMTYVGNAAWAFIRAKDTLQKSPAAIAGLPVIVTDDTMVEDMTSFCERVTKLAPESSVKIHSWSIPLVFSYFAAFVIQILHSLGIIPKLELPPCGLVAYLGSVILYSRARASIHMNYWPKYCFDETYALSTKYYSEVYSKMESDTSNKKQNFLEDNEKRNL